MGKRLADGTWKDSCLDKVAPGEPIFVLRAQDMTAPLLIDLWASMLEMRADAMPDAQGAREVPRSLQSKAREARQTAEAMRAWPTRKLPD